MWLWLAGNIFEASGAASSLLQQLPSADFKLSAPVRPTQPPWPRQSRAARRDEANSDMSFVQKKTTESERKESETTPTLAILLYAVHLPNDTLSITFENTVFSPKENATVSIGSVLKWRARSNHPTGKSDQNHIY
jgi:hypothetical protein